MLDLGPTEPAMSEAIDINETKRSCRARAVESRRAAALADDGTAGTRIAGNLLAAGMVPPGAPVSGFWPIRDEVDALTALRELAVRGHPVALPVVVGRGRPLVFRRWIESDGMATGPFGIREPLDGAPEIEPRVLLVPLLAFDRAGFRLGYGGGFYDRSLAGLRMAGDALAIGIAWAGQEVAAVPRDAHDQPLDWIVTEREAIRIGGERA